MHISATLPLEAPPRARVAAAQATKRPLGIAEAAQALGIPLPAFRSLCDHHGVLEMTPSKGTQNRRLVSEQAEAAGLGRNQDSTSGRVGKRRDHRRDTIFPTFDPARLETLGWLLNWSGLLERVAAVADGPGRVEFLLKDCPELTDGTVANLTSYSREAVRRIRRSGGGLVAGSATVASGGRDRTGTGYLRRYAAKLLRPHPPTCATVRTVPQNVSLEVGNSFH